MHINKYKVVITLVLAAFLVAPSLSFAQVAPATLQTQIQALYAQITQLQGQLKIQGGSVTFCYTFNKNLGIGSTGTDVKNLQTVLRKDGETVTVTGTYDETTASAVSAFQEKYQSQILAPYAKL